MKANAKGQLVALAVLLVMYALLVAAAVGLTPAEQMTSPGGGAAAPPVLPRWQLALANAAIVPLIYGLFALAGGWFARRLQIPWIYREGAGLKALLVSPLLLGLAVGVVLVITDRLFSSLAGNPSFPHPAFPLSLVASGAAAIGEEILFRSFVMGLWAFLISLLLRKWHGLHTALWIGNAIAALAFSASHLPAAMFLLNASSPTDLPAPILLELILLNSLLGLVGGERLVRNGLVAAIGVHFWADVVWHVLSPLIAPS